MSLTIANSLSTTATQAACSTQTEVLNDSASCRAFLIKNGVLLSPEEAKAAYWSLGKNWWMQIIDGKDHKHGPMVYDEGLHKSYAEPGYFKGIESASHYFADHLDQPFSFEIYKEIHHRACAHFSNVSSKEKSGVICTSSEIDSFRTQEEKGGGFPIGEKEFVALNRKKKAIEGMALQLFKKEREVNEFGKEIVTDDMPPFLKEFLKSVPQIDLETRQREFSEAILAAKELLREIGCFPIPDDPALIDSLFTDKLSEINPKLRQIGDECVRKLNEHLNQISARLGLKEPFASCVLGGDKTVCIRYSAASGSLQFEALAQMLIVEFDQNLTRLQKETCVKIQSSSGTKEQIETIKKEYQARAIKLIGRLYAELEWAHPWIDGQGRTDLISLNGLLCQAAGRHPCILKEPYFSTGNSVELWEEYLNAGLVTFEEFESGRAAQT